ncbi:MAG: ABC transporter substrate-binding protein [Chromatiaceae bacterium]|jgi:phospholipid transport system substrate-binding protein
MLRANPECQNGLATARPRSARQWILALTLAAVCASAFAAGASGPQEAQRLIATSADHMLAALQAEGDHLRNNPARIRALAERNLVPLVDFEQVSRLVLGKSWRTATPEQRRRFIREFQRFVVRFYTAALIEYTRGSDIPQDVMRFLPLRAAPGDKRVTVSSRVKQPGRSQVIPVDYRLSLSNGEWKVYDVSVDGVSLVASYRSSFANQIRERGLDGLIAKLAQRNAELDRR